MTLRALMLTAHTPLNLRIAYNTTSNQRAAPFCSVLAPLQDQAGFSPSSTVHTPNLSGNNTNAPACTITLL
jgi:hypothetical protein